MRRRLTALAIGLVLGLGGLWLAHGQRDERAVRVGGDANPCACSQRIEP